MPALEQAAAAGIGARRLTSVGIQASGVCLTRDCDLSISSPPLSTPFRFPTAACSHLGERTLVMGILNVTPDSFARSARPRSTPARRRPALRDGGRRRRHRRHRRRVDAARAPSRSRRRREPRACCRSSGRCAAACAIPISIDTYKADVARAALDAAPRSSTTSAACATTRSSARGRRSAGAALVLMHTRGRSKNDVRARRNTTMWSRRWSRSSRASVACATGGRRAAWSALIVDPGIGFAKRAGAQLWCAGAAGRAGRGARPARARRAVAQVVPARAVGDRRPRRTRLGHGRRGDRCRPRRRAHRPRARRRGDGAGRSRGGGDPDRHCGCSRRPWSG